MSSQIIKTDLVIGMTLAEIFLLILFVVWFSQGTKVGPDLVALERENAALKQEVKEQEKAVSKLQASRDWWRKNWGVNPPESVEELVTVLRSPGAKQFRIDEARGFPRCADNNVLVDVRVNHGSSTMLLTSPAPEFRAWASMHDRAIPATGQTLTDAPEIEGLLNSVTSFYSERVALGKACRFDYRLGYVTHEDYYLGRRKYESQFYPWRIEEQK